MEEEVQNAQGPEIAALFQAGMHFGYAKSRRHPHMRPFLFGVKNTVEVFDLYKVLPKMEEALAFIRNAGAKKQIILFVGTKAAARAASRKTADQLAMPFVTNRWIGGTLTNSKVIMDRVQYWQDLREQQRTGELKKYTKHEQTKLARQIEKMEYAFGGLERMKRLPDALFVIDAGEESLAVREATMRAISIVALSNSDTDPTRITHIIPGNDNAKASIEYILERVARAYEEGVVAGSQEQS